MMKNLVSVPSTQINFKLGIQCIYDILLYNKLLLHTGELKSLFVHVRVCH